MAKEFTIIGYGTTWDGKRDPNQAIYGWVDGGLTGAEQVAVDTGVSHGLLTTLGKGKDEEKVVTRSVTNQPSPDEDRSTDEDETEDETVTEDDNEDEREDDNEDDNERDNETENSGAEFFYGTNIPLSSFQGTNAKREEINNRLRADIAAKDWAGANDALFSAAYWTDPEGRGDGNPHVGKLQRNEYYVNLSPVSWAETSINSSNDEYNIKNRDGSVSTINYKDQGGVTKDNETIGSWGGQGTGENNPHSYDAPPPAGVPMLTPGKKDVSGAGLLGYQGSKGGLGTGVGGLISTTPYTQPAPQDWSAIRPGVFGNPLSELAVAAGRPAQQAIFGPQGRAMQPWATGQQVPAGLINYQIPGGAPANVTYSGGNPSLFDFNNQQNNQNIQNNQNNQNFNYTHSAMNPANPALNAWLTANPYVDAQGNPTQWLTKGGRLSRATDWNASLPKLNLFGDTFDYSTYGGGDELNALDVLAEAEK